MYISNGYGNSPTRITVDSSDTIGSIASYIHMTEQELCEIIQEIVDHDLDSTANKKKSRTFFD